MPILVILFTAGGGVLLMGTKEVNYGHIGGSISRMQWGCYLGCNGTALQPNYMGSWRWPCGFVYQY